MSDLDGLARSKGSIGASLGSNFGNILDLNTGKGRTGALGVDNGELIRGTLRKDAARVLQNLQRPFAGVRKGGCNFEVLDGINLSGTFVLVYLARHFILPPWGRHTCNLQGKGR